MRLYRLKWYAANKEHVIRKAAGWSAANRERRKEIAQRYNLGNKAKARGYYRKNAELIKARSKENYHKNKETRRPKKQEYQRAHLADFACQKRKREALKKNNGPHTLTPKEWRTILAEFGGRCAYCARMLKLTQDHVEPVSKGGTHSPDNAVPACAGCNGSKHARSFLVWLARGGLRDVA